MASCANKNLRLVVLPLACALSPLRKRPLQLVRDESQRRKLADATGRRSERRRTSERNAAQRVSESPRSTPVALVSGKCRAGRRVEDPYANEVRIQRVAIGCLVDGGVGDE